MHLTRVRHYESARATTVALTYFPLPRAWRTIPVECAMGYTEGGDAGILGQRSKDLPGDSISRQYEYEYDLAGYTGSWRSGGEGGAVKKEEHSSEMEEHSREMQEPAHRPEAGEGGHLGGLQAVSCS